MRKKEEENIESGKRAKEKSVGNKMKKKRWKEKRIVENRWKV